MIDISFIEGLELIEYIQIELYFSIIRMFTQNKEDRKRVEKALDISGLPSGKVSLFYYLYHYI